MKTMTATPRLFLSLAEASEATGMSQDYLRGAVANGILRAKRTGPNGGGHYKFRLKDLEDWFDGLDMA
jgi:excisionase family DNA binding protein